MGLSIYPNAGICIVISVVIFILVVILIIIVSRHSCDAALTEGILKTILVVRSIYKQQLTSVIQVLSVACSDIPNALDDPFWHGGLTYLVLTCKNTPHEQG